MERTEKYAVVRNGDGTATVLDSRQKIVSKTRQREMKRKSVKYKAKYLGDDRMDIRRNEVYDCIAELYGDEKTGVPLHLSVIDRSGDACIYPFSDFEKIPEKS